MSLQDISTRELDDLIETINEASKGSTDSAVKSGLASLKGCLIEMKTARSEVQHIEDLFSRGNLTEDVYLVKHKQLTRDFNTARANITEDTVPKLANLVANPSSRGALQRIADSIRENKDFVLGLSQFVVALINATHASG